MTKTTFNNVPIGIRFTFRGCEFIKTALNMAEDEARNGNIFMAEAQVEIAEQGDQEPPE